MAKGRDAFDARRNELSLFGKDLARRSGRKCELCQAQGVSLSIFEVPPVPKAPDFDHCIFICSTCAEQIEQPKRRDANHWRCLTQSVWNETPSIQAISVALLSTFDTDWAQDTREIVFCDDSISAWSNDIIKDIK
jgi:protein PhnA